VRKNHTFRTLHHEESVVNGLLKTPLTFASDWEESPQVFIKIEIQTSTIGRRQIRISKFEFRNKFKARMPQCSELKPSGLPFLLFEFGTLGIVSNFVLRISDFRLLYIARKSASS